MDPQEKINILRNKIDDLDNQILDFLVQRFSISREIGEIKVSSKGNICDKVSYDLIKESLKILL